MCGPDALVQGMEEQRRVLQPFESVQSAQRRQIDPKRVTNMNGSRLKVSFHAVGRGGKHASLRPFFRIQRQKEEKKEGTGIDGINIDTALVTSVF